MGDITRTEPNIHAGVKYMRWMIDQYYKAVFAFASYDAGARRISQLRNLAAKRGLDPNVWFDNVEYVAAEKIGAETVTYVRRDAEANRIHETQPALGSSLAFSIRNVSHPRSSLNTGRSMPMQHSRARK